MRSVLRSIRQFLSELRRRNVYQVAVTYVLVGVFVIEAADLTLTRLGLPPWTVTLVIVLVGLGFPIALVMTWALEVTPDGVRVEEADGTEEEVPAPSGSPRDLWVGASVLVLLLVGAWWLFPVFSGEAGEETAKEPGATSAVPADTAEASSRDRPFVAVLPLENLSPKEENQFFADGIHEEILGQLSKVSGLGVFARTTMVQYADTEKPVSEIGRELGAQAVLEGSVRRAGGRVRISAQLIDPQSRDHLWSDTYEREMSPDAVFDIQAEIAERIAAALETELTDSERKRIAAVPTRDQAAYDAYLKGRALAQQFEWDQATEYLRRALKHDSTFAPAWVALADVRADERYFGTGGREAHREAMRYARRALKLDPDLAEAHAQLGSLHWRLNLDPAAAEQSLRRAVQLDPSSTEARRAYGTLLAAQGSFEEALAQLRAARRLDPLDPGRTVYLAWAYVLADRHDEALRAARKALKLEPGHEGARLWLAAAHLGQGRAETAVEELERLDFQDAPTGRLILARAYAAAGRREDARRIAEDIISSEKKGDLSPYWAAAAHVVLGNDEAALDLLEKAYEQRRGQLVFLKTSPFVDGLRDRPRFQELVRKVGLEQEAGPSGEGPSEAPTEEPRGRSAANGAKP